MQSAVDFRSSASKENTHHHNNCVSNINSTLDNVILLSTDHERSLSHQDCVFSSGGVARLQTGKEKPGKAPTFGDDCFLHLLFAIRDFYDLRRMYGTSRKGTNGAGGLSTLHMELLGSCCLQTVLSTLFFMRGRAQTTEKDSKGLQSVTARWREHDT